ncbi:MAG TPA: LLM class flavin-dependent oxidoreductase [Microlunatus sp.]|nr:LLM class flavin-dependent oxidoreductase [Microlunatus sp.]
MRLGAHLPLVDLGGPRLSVSGLNAYARTVSDLGFRAIAANDHLTFTRPWLDGIVALASVLPASGDLTLATTAALPVIRRPVVLARAAAALDELSAGRLLLGVAAGSSRADYDLVGLDFDRRWVLFDEALTELRRRVPDRPLWVASWGSPAGLRRVARWGDGWLASAYNTTPAEVVSARALLRDERARLDLHGPELGCAVTTMWTRVTVRGAEQRATLEQLSGLLGRPQEVLAGQLLVGSPEHCAGLVRGYARAGVDLLCLWPVGDPERELERFKTDVLPLLEDDAPTDGRPWPRPAGRSSGGPGAAPGPRPAGPH